MAEKSIKWRRKVGRPLNNAAERQAAMDNQLLKEQYEEYEPGQLFRLTKDHSGIYNASVPGWMVKPDIKAGEILMYLKWVDKQTLVEIGDSFSTIPVDTKNSGPVWLYKGKIHYRRILMRHLEAIEVNKDEEEEE